MTYVFYVGYSKEKVKMSRDQLIQLFDTSGEQNKLCPSKKVSLTKSMNETQIDDDMNKVA